MKVSVCIPAYKHPHFLKRCLDSVLEQDFADYEIIITDDSPDDTLAKLVLTYDDGRIHYYKNDKPLGSPRNWNEGIEKAQGEYLKILHHDDWLATPQSLSKFVSLLDDNKNVDIAFSASCDRSPDGRKKITIVDAKKLPLLKKNPQMLFRGNLLGAPSVCIFRNHKDYLFDPGLIWLVDTEFFIRLSKNKSFAYIPEILVNIGISEHQITHSDLINYKRRIAEGIYLYNKFNLKKESPTYRYSLLKTMGRAKIFNNKALKNILPDTDFALSLPDSLRTYYYFIKRKAGLILNK